MNNEEIANKLLHALKTEPIKWSESYPIEVEIVVCALDSKDKAHKNEIERLSDNCAELQDFAKWLTGCGYNFCQHELFINNKHLLYTQPPIQESEK